MKRIIIIFALLSLFAANGVSAQEGFVCLTPPNAPISAEVQRLQNEINTMPHLLRQKYVPNADREIKILRVAFHFITHEPSHPDYPGNFSTKSKYPPAEQIYDDCYKSSEDMLGHWNWELAYGEIAPLLPPNNNIPVLKRNIRFELCGVYVHEDEGVYNAPWGITQWGYPDQYAVGDGSCINMYFLKPTEMLSGYSGSSSKAVNIFSAWVAYKNDYESKQNGEPAYQTSIIIQTILHETGHTMNLDHTIRLPNGTIANVDDHCDDTPTLNEMTALLGYSPARGWMPNSDSLFTNNLMDYSGYKATTPDQLARVHHWIDTYLKSCKKSQYDLQAATIGTLADSKTVIAGSVETDPTKFVAVKADKSLYIRAREVKLDKGFSVDKGGVLDISVEKYKHRLLFVD